MEAERFGGPQVLTARQVPDPVAGPGQVVVRTSAADVLFVDTFIRAGSAVDFFPIRPPYVPGNGAAGQVISFRGGTLRYVGSGSVTLATCITVPWPRSRSR